MASVNRFAGPCAGCSEKAKASEPSIVMDPTLTPSRPLWLMGPNTDKRLYPSRSINAKDPWLFLMAKG